MQLERDGFVATLWIKGDQLYGEVRDTHELVSIAGASVAELRSQLASKLKDYCARCKRRGISPFTTPGGKSTIETQAELSSFTNNTLPPEPHQHFQFLQSKASLFEDQICSWENLKSVRSYGIPKSLELPIDKVVEKLRSRKRPPLLVDAWLRPPGQDTLFIELRRGLRGAFLCASTADPRNRAKERDFDFQFLDNARELDAVASKFQARYINRKYAGGLPRFSRGLDPAVAFEHVGIAVLAEECLSLFLEQLHLLMSWAHEDMNDLAREIGGRPRLTWKYDFVAPLAELWQALTSRKPSSRPDGLFVEFVDAAWLSGGDDMPSVSWDETVRNFCNGLKKGG